MSRLGVLLLLVLVSSAGAVVIRHDVSDFKYRVAASSFPSLVDLPVEGHGVLIAPQWVVTAAHAVAWQPQLKFVVVDGSPRAVNKLIFHPGYKQLPLEMIEAAMKSGNASAAMKFLASSDDIALVKLAAPVTDVASAKIYRGSSLGKVVRLIGKGATGTGALGHDPDGPNRTNLRHAFNLVTLSQGRWLAYVFDGPPNALALEGMAGNGDSGGPLLVAVDNEWHVAGLTSWKRVDGNPATFRPGKYGQINYGVRLGHYLGWIEATTASGSAAKRQRSGRAKQH